MSYLLPVLELGVWPKISGILFLSFFLLLLFYVYWPSRRSFYDEQSHLVFDSNDSD